jgi:hypothetical protein
MRHGDRIAAPTHHAGGDAVMLRKQILTAKGIADQAERRIGKHDNRHG